jgi:hypothetical protein
MAMPKDTNDAATLFIWVTDILLEAHAIVPCLDHGYLLPQVLHYSQHAAGYPSSTAQHREFLSKNKKQRMKAVEKRLGGLAYACPADK